MTNRLRLSLGLAGWLILGRCRLLSWRRCGGRLWCRGWCRCRSWLWCERVRQAWDIDEVLLEGPENAAANES